MWQQIFLGFLGLCSGIIIAGGAVGLMIGLSIMPRYAGITRTADSVLLYEDMTLLGFVFGNVFCLFHFSLPLGIPFLIVYGVFSGISWKLDPGSGRGSLCRSCLFQEDPPDGRIPGSHSLYRRREMHRYTHFLLFWLAISLNHYMHKPHKSQTEREEFFMTNKQQLQKQKKYEQYVKSVTPTHSLPINMAKAFLTGGLICLLGQFILNTAQSMGIDQKSAGSWCSLLLILLSVLLTGFNLYSKIGKFGGAGSLVPITGFANSVAASAIEFQAEGQIFGIGCKIFTIAGPVILYGILSSWLLGIIYYILKLMEVIG